MFGNQFNKLQGERDDLVSLVSSGQDIMADLVKENEELEQQLTLHIASQKTRLLGDDDPAEASTEDKKLKDADDAYK